MEDDPLGFILAPYCLPATTRRNGHLDRRATQLRVGAVLSVVTFLSAWRLPRHREAAAPQAGVRDMFGGLVFVARNRFLRVATLVAAPIFALL
ncbi:hypothetical protein, partial [Buchananella hordeovulneris]|uniref:hypothetical protein n=1 Tax=Buchananella hordeovulneris TaxID=52770 RepID=UPI001639FF5C